MCAVLVSNAISKEVELHVQIQRNRQNRLTSSTQSQNFCSWKRLIKLEATYRWNVCYLVEVLNRLRESSNSCSHSCANYTVYIYVPTLHSTARRMGSEE